MNRRRQLAVGFFSVVIVIVLGLIVYVANVNASQKVNVWVVKAAVAAGASYTPDVVTQVPVTARENDFSFTKKVPDSGGAFHFAVGMSPGDIVRDNDLIPQNQLVPINITVAGGPAVVAGDYADIYADNTTTSAGGPGGAPTAGATGPVLIAHAVAVTSGSATSLTILIPVRLTPMWVAITANLNIKLYAVKNFPGTSVPTGNGGSIDTVIAFLNSGALASGSGVGTGPAPSPTQ